MKIKNKLFIILFFLFMFILVFNIKSFANIEFEYNSNSYSIDEFSDFSKDTTKYIIVLTRWAGSEYFTIYYTNNENIRFYHTSSGFYISNSKNIYIRDYKNGVWGEAKNWGNLENVSSFVTANQDIYNEDNTLFFQVPPLYQITRITEVTEITGVIAGVMKATIPVGLIVLSMVLLIFLIKSVISRVV